MVCPRYIVNIKKFRIDYKEEGTGSVEKRVKDEDLFYRGVFLALRMFVNDELNEFKFALSFAEKVLKKGRYRTHTVGAVPVPYF